MLLFRRKLRGAAPYLTGKLGISCSIARACGRIAMRDGNEDGATEKGFTLFRRLLSLKLNVMVANGTSLSPTLLPISFSSRHLAEAPHLPPPPPFLYFLSSFGSLRQPLLSPHFCYFLAANNIIWQPLPYPHLLIFLASNASS
jgi:hypothetical protein